jgi:hypothetical protein
MHTTAQAQGGIHHDEHPDTLAAVWERRKKLWGNGWRPVGRIDIPGIRNLRPPSR